MTTNRTACVTGTDRGVGLALVHRLLEAEYTVFAGGIQPDNDGIRELKERYRDRLHAFKLDVGSDESVKAAAALIAGHTDRLELLINNAAILGDTEKTILDEIDFEEVQRNFNITALGAIRMSNALIGPIMNGGKLIVTISSEAGSIGDCYREAWFGYSMAKAAVNMGSVIIHNKIRPDGGRVILLHPGWVKTFMSGEWNDAGKNTPEESAANILKTIEARKDEIGKQPLYLEADTGKLLPW